ncbi:uncharacterized protein LOC26514350 isoform X2 [Drosophila ananassae]|uniref:uncharacterized protein LOC26514350 isoform X2 n=1 Tax=Drosophila ananassae TaxID=7217 RepID=UPI001CFFEC79|nr:uncharacterized protein LOC26514350 isoform X2 [Drosophila ananassae]
MQMVKDEDMDTIKAGLGSAHHEWPDKRNATTAVAQETLQNGEPTDPKVIPPMKHTRQVIMMLPTCHHHHPPTASLPLCLPGARRPRTCEDTSHDQPVGASQSVHCTEILSTGSSKGGDHGK